MDPGGLLEDGAAGGAGRGGAGMSLFKLFFLLFDVVSFDLAIPLFFLFLPTTPGPQYLCIVVGRLRGGVIALKGLKYLADDARSPSTYTLR